MFILFYCNSISVLAGNSDSHLEYEARDPGCVVFMFLDILGINSTFFNVNGQRVCLLLLLSEPCMKKTQVSFLFFSLLPAAVEIIQFRFLFFFLLLQSLASSCSSLDGVVLDM